MDLTSTELLILALGAMGLGIVLLIRGGNWTIDAAVYIARNLGISPLVVGFTIIAFGTSLPELIVSVLANLQGSAGIAIGNVLGSNIANILMVIGMSAIFVTIQVSSKAVFKDLYFMLASTVVLMGALMYGGDIGLLAGLAMVAALVGYVLFQYKMAKSGEVPLEEPDDPEFPSQLVAYGFLLLGMIAIALGADFLVRGAKVSASVLGVPEAVIALSIIAFGTSLPELSTCIIAVRRGHGDIALGNIIGSNVFNILMIIGVTAVIKPIMAGSFAPQLVDFDIWVTAGVSLMFAVLLMTYGKVTKPIGIVFFAAYILYNVYIYGINIAG